MSASETQNPSTPVVEDSPVEDSVVIPDAESIRKTLGTKFAALKTAARNLTEAWVTFGTAVEAGVVNFTTEYPKVKVSVYYEWVTFETGIAYSTIRGYVTASTLYESLPETVRDRIASVDAYRKVTARVPEADRAEFLAKVVEATPADSPVTYEEVLKAVDAEYPPQEKKSGGSKVDSKTVDRIASRWFKALAEAGLDEEGAPSVEWAEFLGIAIRKDSNQTPATLRACLSALLDKVTGPDEDQS